MGPDGGTTDTRDIMRFAAWGACVVVALSCLGCGPSGDVVAFVNVNVISMATEGVLAGQTVVVRDGLIAEVGTTGEVSVPRGATRVDGAGERYLMPGLVDTHVHLEDQLDAETWLPLFVASGVTTVFNLTGAPPTLELRRRVEEGEVLGPTIYTSGPFTNLPQVTTPEDAETWVRRQKEAGYDFVKVHGPVAEDAFIRMNEVGRAIDMPILGHAPRNLPFKAVLENGQVAVVHAEELIYTYFQQLDASRIPDLARRMADAGTYLTTTVSMFENIVRLWGVPAVMDTVLTLPEARYLNPKMRAFWTRGNPYTGRPPAGRERVGAMYRFQLDLIQQLHEAGVPLMLGTDTPLPVMYPGSSLLLDVENFSRAGLDASEVLAAGTRIPGEFISRHVDPRERFGTVTVGSRADLILLEVNPLEDLDALSSPSGVMLRGRWFDRAALDGLLDGVAETFAGMEEEYDDPAIAMSAEELAPFAGRFNGEGWGINVRIGLQDDELRLFMSQPLLLVPIGPGRFRADAFIWRLTYSEDLATVIVTHDGNVEFIFHRLDEPAQ